MDNRMSKEIKMIHYQKCFQAIGLYLACMLQKAYNLSSLLNDVAFTFVINRKIWLVKQK
ncbi:hypothetical protein Hanom_Chr15g01410431 [Helianthus anomalus]